MARTKYTALNVDSGLGSRSRKTIMRVDIVFLCSALEQKSRRKKREKKIRTSTFYCLQIYRQIFFICRIQAMPNINIPLNTINGA